MNINHVIGWTFTKQNFMADIASSTLLYKTFEGENFSDLKLVNKLFSYVTCTHTSSLGKESL